MFFYVQTVPYMCKISSKSTLKKVAFYNRLETCLNIAAYYLLFAIILLWCRQVVGSKSTIILSSSKKSRIAEITDSCNVLLLWKLVLDLLRSNFLNASSESPSLYYSLPPAVVCYKFRKDEQKNMSRYVSRTLVYNVNMLTVNWNYLCSRQWFYWSTPMSRYQPQVGLNLWWCTSQHLQLRDTCRDRPFSANRLTSHAS